MFTAEGNTNAKGNTIPGLREKLIKYKYLAPTQKASKCPGGGGRCGGGGFVQLQQIYLFVVLIFYNDISQHM